MLEAFRLCALHTGRRIVVTPGLVESSKEQNERIAREIDSLFDIAIITGELNSKILASNISNAQKIILKDKANLNRVLAHSTRSGDLILFANDAPNFI